MPAVKNVMRGEVMFLNNCDVMYRKAAVIRCIERGKPTSPRYLKTYTDGLAESGAGA